MRTQIGLLSGAYEWLICALIIAVATLGKFGGTYVAARLTGLRRAESSALGLLMNTRGLMELIVLNIGLDLGVISPKLFAMMVIMALVTTVATSPLLLLLKPFLDLQTTKEAEDHPMRVYVPAGAAVAVSVDRGLDGGLVGLKRAVTPTRVAPGVSER
jgi:Kef-type K+ transport system membrane component KefB